MSLFTNNTIIIINIISVLVISIIIINTFCVSNKNVVSKRDKLKLKRLEKLLQVA